MASTAHFVLILLSTLFFVSHNSFAQTSFRPRALVLPVTKDSLTNQYVTQLNQRTPLVPLKLTIDLGGKYLWVDCEQDYVSSSYRPVHCRTAQCALSNSKACGDCPYTDPKPGCSRNSCVQLPYNPFKPIGMDSELAEDVVSIQSTNGVNPGQVVSVPRFIFTCAQTVLLRGLANGVKGIVGLGRTQIGVPAQFSRVFSFDRKFAICMSSSNGVIFFGDGPYTFLPQSIDFSKSLVYTPLFVNPVNNNGMSFEGEKSANYFIGVNSIKINGIAIPLNTTLLSIDKEGKGGTKISTAKPYTVLETSIYNAFTQAFIKQVGNIPRVTPVAPFTTCYNSKSFAGTRVGPSVPQIDLVLQSESVFWSIFGANSMVQVNDNVLCLAFVDGGVDPITSIVIGGHQIENNLLQFDFATSRLGFSSSLLFRQTTCANFNFTSNV